MALVSSAFDSICSTLGDLYSNQYCGRMRFETDERHGGDGRCDGLDKGQQDHNNGTKSDRKNGGSQISCSKDNVHVETSR